MVKPGITAYLIDMERMILMADKYTELEGRVEALEQEVYLLKKLLNDVLNQGQHAHGVPEDSGADPHVEDAEDSWYTDHGHGD